MVVELNPHPLVALLQVQWIHGGYDSSLAFSSAAPFNAARAPAPVVHVLHGHGQRVEDRLKRNLQVVVLEAVHHVVVVKLLGVLPDHDLAAPDVPVADLLPRRVPLGLDR